MKKVIVIVGPWTGCKIFNSYTKRIYKTYF